MKIGGFKISITNVQLAIIGLIALALLLAFKGEYSFVLAIITLLGGILVPTPIGGKGET